MAELHIDKQAGGGKTVFALAGRMDTTTSPALQDVLLDEFDAVKDVALDMKDLVYISSAGLRVLLSAQKKANATAGSFRVVGVNQDIMEIMEMTGFTDVLTIEGA